MFARWSQENFFKYMRENYNLDRLADYSVNDIPDTTRVVCPLYREADRDVKKLAGQLGRKRCECNEVVLCDTIEPDKVIAYEKKKEALLFEKPPCLGAALSDLLCDLSCCFRMLLE